MSKETTVPVIVLPRFGAQGDMLLLRVDSIPEGLPEVPRVNGRLIVTHSETGHHHTITRPRVTMYQDPDPLLAWLEVHDEADLPQLAELVHERSWDTHPTLALGTGFWKIHRQQESTPTGWRPIRD